MKTRLVGNISTLLLFTLVAAGCGRHDGFEGGGKGGARGGEHGDCDDEDRNHDGPPRRRHRSLDAGSKPADPVVDAGSLALVDTGAPVDPPPADAGVLEPDSGPAAIDAGALVADAAPPPDSGVPPPECVHDTDCASGRVCTAGGACILPDCADVRVEAACLARPDCMPVYAGMNCVDAQGGECTSGDTSCVCATYAFAVCAHR